MRLLLLSLLLAPAVWAQSPADSLAALGLNTSAADWLWYAEVVADETPHSEERPVRPEVLARIRAEAARARRIYTRLATYVPPPTPAPAYSVIRIGSGADSLLVFVAQDFFEGPARYTVAVDGARVGPELEATALNASPVSDTLVVRGDFAPGTRRVTINFTNDLYRGSRETDRNLYVRGMVFRGEPVPRSALVFLPGGPQTVAFEVPEPPAPPEPPETVETLRAELAAVRSLLLSAETKRDTFRAERDSFRSERDTFRRERDDALAALAAVRLELVRAVEARDVNAAVIEAVRSALPARQEAAPRDR